MSAAIPASSEETRQRDLLAYLGRSLFDRGLTAGSSGNLSVRLEDGWLLTPTNACLGRLDPARLAKLDWEGRLLSGDPPSKEATLHQAMYRQRPSAWLKPSVAGLTGSRPGKGHPYSNRRL